jgi:gliding motility-associated-like protein
MKQIFTLFLFLISISLFAQAPPNDDCDFIVDLGVAPFCPEGIFYSNTDATPSDVLPGSEAPIDCNSLGEPQTDVWFYFTAVDTILDYTITLTGLDNPDTGESAITNPVIVVYRGEGPCEEMEQLQCEAANIGDNNVELVFDTELTPGAEYYMRIFDYSVTGTPNSGAFQLCVDETEVPPNLCENIVTDECSGEIFDCGGPDGDYMSNENFTLTITPEGGAACITMSLLYYNIDAFGDAITFYDGPTATGTPISVISGGQNGDNTGGACFQASASSGSLTMQFTSDGFTEFEGFHAVWECSDEPCIENAQMTLTNTDITNEQIAEIVTTPQSQVTVTNINCADGAYGTFEGADNTDLGLGRGLVLSTGQILDNDNIFTSSINQPASDFASNDNGFDGDDDLAFLSGFGTFDACIVELEVFANTNQLNFEYVFGSEEYPEFVGGTVNDVFAFLASGPGITGDPGLNGQLNMATLPNGTAVTINDVNDALNNEFYRNNEFSNNVVYDGLTSDFQGVKKSLTATVDVIPCNTYNLKLGIADGGDGVFDSGVFISEITGGIPTVSVDYQNGIQYLVEECTSLPDEVVIDIGQALDTDQTFEVIIGGTAEQGIDYDLVIPPTITFLAGDTIQTFPITTLTDGIPEGTENILITLRANFGCGDIVLSELEIQIEDALAVEIFAGADTTFVCTDSCVIMDVIGAPNYVWTPSDQFDPPNVPNPQICPTESQLVYVVGFLGVCTAIDSVQIEVVNPTLAIETNDVLDICEGSSVSLTADNNVGDANLMWTPGDGSILDPTLGTIEATPLVTTTYTATVEVAGCVASDEVTVNVDPFDFPDVIEDATICQNSSIQLAPPILNTTTQFTWTPDVALAPDNTVAGVIATPDETTTYTVFADSENGFCPQSESVTITVIPADVDVTNALPIEICLGESVDITATSTHSDLVTWTPSETLEPATGTTVTATPTETTTYIANLEVSGCSVADTITVRVDSLPASALVELIPEEEFYCEGEIITMVFPTYEPANFSDIEHSWTPNTGLESPDSLWNLVISAVETTTYVRETTNHACSVTEEVFINVVETEDLILTVTPETICPGEEVQFELTSVADLGGITWNTNPEGLNLSCDDCPNPTANPNVTVDVSATSETEEGSCPLNSNVVTVTVEPEPTLNVTASLSSICLGATTTLNANNAFSDVVWTDETGNTISNASVFDVMPTVTTTYTATASNGICDDAVQSITINVDTEEPTIELDASDFLLCQGEEVSLTAVTNGDSGSTLWSTGEVGASISPSPNETSTFTAVYTNSCGVEATAEITIDVEPDFVIDSTTAVPDTVFAGENVTLSVFHTVTVGPMYEWTMNGNNVSIEGPITVVESPQYDGEGEEPQSVNYSVFITSEAGCNHSIQGEFFILNSIFEVPNVFTPNGDETNDFFYPIATGANTIIDFRVFNRWGQPMYENETPMTGWDGNFKEKPAPADVYAYVVKYINALGEEVTAIGDVTLVR